jgi:phosphoglycolate phosphatase
MILDKNKKTVLFDFDGTIADTFEHMLDTLDQYTGDFGVELSDPKLLEDLRSLSAEELFKKFRIPRIFIPFLIRKLQKNFSKHVDEVFPFSDVIEEIRGFRHLYNIGIVTSNSKSNVVRFLKKENIMDLFDFVYSESTLFGKHKLINKVVSKYKLDKRDVVYIGDEARDVTAANNAEVAVISVGWGFNSKKLLMSLNAKNYIENFTDLSKKLITVFNS